MKIHSMRWLYVVCVMLGLAVMGLAAPGHAALAQPDRVTLTVEGFIDSIGAEGVQVVGTISEMDGTAGDWGIGSPVALTVIPAARFNRFEEGDEVIVSGTLLDDGETLRANRVQLMDAEDSDDEDEGDGEEVRAHCPALDPHPAAEKLAVAFDVTAEQVMGWFCEGFGFGEIKLALRIAENAEGTSVEYLLAAKSEGKGWGEIIHGLEMSPSEVNPGLGVGKPDDVGKPEDTGKPEGVGKPDNPGRPEDPGSQGRGHSKGSKS